MVNNDGLNEIRYSNQQITVSCEIFNNETELRQMIGFFTPRFLGSASNINGFSNDFIRETWDRINWMEIFRWWYQRYERQSIGQGIRYTFNRFMKQIDPDGEFYKAV